MWNTIHKHQNLIGTIFLLYLLPIILVCSYATWAAPIYVGWTILSLGLLLSSIGSLIFFSIVRKEIESVEMAVPISTPETREPPSKTTSEKIKPTLDEQESIHSLSKALEEAHQKQLALIEEINYRNQEIQKLNQEKNHHEREYSRIKEEFSFFKTHSEDALQDEKNRTFEYQESISDLRAAIDQKQNLIEKLENKIRDLTYEIKTLLQLADMGTLNSASKVPEDQPITLTDDQSPPETTPELMLESDSLVLSAEDAKTQLKRCIDIAQKLTGSHHFNNQQSRFGDFPLDKYALDLRRLYDSLRSETNSTILVYSPKESKPLFVNNQIKTLLGWSPEKFIHDFDNIVQEGLPEWKQTISQLSFVNECQTRLVMKSRSGEDHLIRCHLGLIPTGTFRNHVIGIFYPN